MKIKLFECNDFRVQEENNTICIVSYLGSESSVAIPSTLSEKPVTKIADEAFSKNTTIEELTLPSTLTTIGWKSFAACTSLKQIRIPHSVVSIEPHAFMDCSNLEIVIFECNIKSIPIGCFKNCSSLLTIEFPKHLNTIENFAFSGCSKLDKLLLPKGLEQIKLNAFDAFNPESIPLFPKSLKKLEPGSFPTIADLTFFDELPKGSYSNQFIRVLSSDTGKTLYRIWAKELDKKSKFFDKDGQFNLQTYDTEVTKKSIRLIEAAAIARLQYPYLLEPEHKKIYVDALRFVSRNRLLVFVKSGDMESIQLWGSLKTISKKTCEELIEYSSKNKLSELTTFLLNFKDQTFTNKEKEYEL